MGGPKQNKRVLHEDDDDAYERDEAIGVEPLDVVAMRQLLESMGADKFEPRVVSQLQEFVHRYVTEILVDAQEYSMYADKQTIDADDVRLAIASRLNHHYAQVPSRELMMELADKRNSIPLPPISNEYGVRLPPIQYQLITKESDRQEQEKLQMLFALAQKLLQ
ncbi:Transcription initiation factor TFIID subunit 9B [Phytophthora boehmeriae]|uniref:Transcription initiation factor TFIID subunit 9B n=1 Tax=Phytophthora boehmeriae TaxID=109152 RepID=A0A8T1X9D3_9STRA|nr:Transcription initiation factor TFIID subunit 9B [Phytophthora boehmeriae]